jgi:hypothetical protein
LTVEDRVVSGASGAAPAPEGGVARLLVSARRISPDTWAMIAIAAAVVVANLPYLVGLFDPNPLGPRSGLLSAISAGSIRGQPTLDPNNGFISQALSHRAMIDLVHLHLPWWNPYEATGAPLAGELQSAALFPPTLLTLLSNGQLYEHMLLELLAGISTYLLLRRLSLGRWACVAGAILFALNGTFAWFSHATVNPVAFLPMLLLGIERAYAASVAGDRGGWWLIAVAGALSFYAGFPEVAYIDTLLAVCWFAWRCGCVGRQRVWGFAGKAAIGGAVGTALSAPLLIASIDYLNHADLGFHGTTVFASRHIVAQGLPQLLLPYVYGPIYGFADPKLSLTSIWGNVGGYLSTSLLLFALLGVFSKGRRVLRVILLAWIVLVVARIYGQPPVLGDVLGLLPGMSRVAFFRYASASLELPVAILAALGIDQLLGAPPQRRRVVWAALAALAVVALAALTARPLANQLGSTFRHRPYFAGAIVWGAAVVIAGAAAALVRNPRSRGVLVALVVAVDAVALFMVTEFAAPRKATVDLAPATFLQQHLGTSRFFTLGPLQPNYGSYFGISSLNINDIPIPQNFADYVHARLDQTVDPTVFVGNLGGGRSPFAPSPAQQLIRNLAAYRQAGVAYVLTPAGQRLPQSAGTFQLVYRTPSTWIYHLAGAAPYFSTTGSRCRTTPDGRDAVRLSCPAPTVLVRRETDFPGWSARVDGHSVAVGRADGLFQAVAVGAGEHRVTFGYAPPNILWGALAFLAGCLALLATAVRRLPAFKA